MPVWLQIVLGLLGGIGVIALIVRLIVRAQVLEEIRKVEQNLEQKMERRIDKIEESFKNDIRPIIALLYNKPANPLTPAENNQKNKLLMALEVRKLTVEEAKELQKLLQKELDEAQKNKDTATVVAIIAVLLLLAFILSKE